MEGTSGVGRGEDDTVKKALQFFVWMATMRALQFFVWVATIAPICPICGIWGLGRKRCSQCNQLLKDKTAEADSKGRTPLHHAVRGGGGSAVVRFLLWVGANPVAKDKNLRTPLHYAATQGHSDVCMTLLQFSDKEARDKHGFTATHCAAAWGHDALLGLVMTGSDPTAKTPDGRTPLDLAVATGAPGMVLMMLRQKWDPMPEDESPAAAGKASRKRKQ